MIHIIGGGTFSHVRNHLALAAPAFGETAKKLHGMFTSYHIRDGGRSLEYPQLHLTKMADSNSTMVTNEHVAHLIDELIADNTVKVIIMNAALCDYDGKIVEERHGEEVLTASGKYATRLKTQDGIQNMALVPADKVIGCIRKTRKDIFAVGFKTTTGATPDEQYAAALKLLKTNSLNLVVANDTVTRHNMIVAPEETRYYETDNRDEMLHGLVKMVLARKDNTFTRSTVVEGSLVDWNSDARIPDSLRTVVDHCVGRGAYKPVLGKTAGHFAVRVDANTCLTSVRKTNFNETLDLVQIDYEGLDKVIAHGAKPSVGGQSQRIIFDQYPELDCIFHAHVEMKPDAPDAIPIAEQWEYQCGSHNCGRNTSDNLKEFDNRIHAVMLRGHGPNIVFPRDTPSELVVDFIERNFDLTRKTGETVAA
jgi:hypothetical protein